MIKLLPLQAWYGLLDQGLEYQSTEWATVNVACRKVDRTQVPALGLSTRKKAIQDATSITADHCHAKADVPQRCGADAPKRKKTKE